MRQKKKETEKEGDRKWQTETENGRPRQTETEKEGDRKWQTETD